MTVSLAPLSPAAAPRSSASRCYGQATILMRRGGGLTTADAALVTPYLPGTSEPYPDPLYGGPDATEALAFPVATGGDGVVALWADAPGRLELEAVHPVLGRARGVLDLEPDPDAAPEAVDAYSKPESDARYEPLDTAYSKAEADARYLQAPLTAGQIPAEFLTVTEGDARYALSGTTPTDVYTKPESDARFLQLTGGTVSGPVTGLWNGPGVTRTLTVGVAPPGAPAPDDLWVTDGDGGGGAVESVNGLTGVVVLGAADVGALTQTAGDARYLQPATAAGTYLPLAGGSVLTGTIGPTTTNAVDTGTTALRWRKLWAVNAEFTNPPSYGGAAQPKVTVASSAPGSPATGDLWVW